MTAWKPECWGSTAANIAWFVTNPGKLVGTQSSSGESSDTWYTGYECAAPLPLLIDPLTLLIDSLSLRIDPLSLLIDMTPCHKLARFRTWCFGWKARKTEPERLALP